VFPEGHISRTGQLMEIKKGFELMARQAGVPVVGGGDDGLWAGVFFAATSIFGNRRLMPTPVFIARSDATSAESRRPGMGTARVARSWMRSI